MPAALQLQFPGLDGQITHPTSQFTASRSTRLYEGQDLGTFKDSLRSPIHRWFKYPAGYSYKFVDATFKQFDIKSGNWVYDPFSGTGTTLLCAKQAGINGYGVEAHSFVHWVSNVKLYWDFEVDQFSTQLNTFLSNCRHVVRENLATTQLGGVFPPLVYKCYHPRDLQQLYLIREYICQGVSEIHLQDFLKLALTDTLREAAAAGTGWPYISPKKNTRDKPPKKALKVFEKTCRQMYEDFLSVRLNVQAPWPEIQLVLGDSRQRQKLADGQIDIAITSPPYLNNYDYADRTRLESYFWGLATSWGDITRQYRQKLMVAATTQITRSDLDVHTVLNKELKELAPKEFEILQTKILQLSNLRLQKSGKKSYDLMVALYFNDIFKVLHETYRVLRRGGKFCLVLGDSAPYGIHVQTDNLIGKLGRAIGFEKFDYYELRRRGEKWKDNPQRHSVALREGVVVLTK